MRAWKPLVAVAATAFLVPSGLALGRTLTSSGGVQLCASAGNGAVKSGSNGCAKGDSALPALATEDDLTALESQVAAQAQTIASLKSQLTSDEATITSIQDNTALQPANVTGSAAFDWNAIQGLQWTTTNLVGAVCLLPDVPGTFAWDEC